jgi:transmembrane sensor
MCMDVYKHYTRPLMKHHINKRLLDKFFRNECTREESQAVMEWLNSSQDKDEAKTIMQQQWDELHPEAGTGVDFDRMLGNIHRRIGQGQGITFEQFLAQKQEEVQASGQVKSPRKWPWYAEIWKVAAACTAILVVTLLVRMALTQDDKWIVYQTQYGEIKYLTLPDSSTVSLNGNSSIKYLSQWDASKPREVLLVGEAFFEVTHTINHQKFIVKTANQLDVEVLGTKFTVSDRNGKTRVVLNSGKVQLHIPSSSANSANQLVMKPGELAEYTASQQKVVTRIVKPEVYSSWKDKKLIFDNTSMEEIASILEQTYGFTVTIADEALKTRRFKGSFPVDNIDGLLEALSISFNLDITRSGDQIQFSSKTSPLQK